MNTPEHIPQHFNHYATRYDNPVTAFIGEQELRGIRQFIPSGSQVLDYGCGTGRTTLDLLRRGCHVTAYDLSPNMLAIAAQRAGDKGFSATFTSDDAQLLGQSWPFITCIGVLDYYPNPLPLLQTLQTYLTPTGVLIVTYPNALSPVGWLYAVLSRWTLPATPRSPSFARRMAHQAGFQEIGFTFRFPALPPLGMTFVQALTPAASSQSLPQT